eukprot:CAMPEP_0179057660 /NCGR_PEP_ID=MMETSP0796-20121207/24448_1 /TAXON_ID=73915 /ORGANISM="Pyrodinium bahamense, Strain pbaha01" /LENGTH=159 /DNA_ID=CAMNT_0020754385 /DNA_START=88 /DNA_END=567 /DNA_ORIENTATION=+
MALRLALLAAACLLAPVAAYVQPTRVGGVAPGGARHRPTITNEDLTVGVEIAGEPFVAGANAEAPALGLAALGCGLGAALGWASTIRRRQRRQAAAAASAAALAAPLAAGAAEGAAGRSLENSVVLASDWLANPDIGFVFLTSLISMSIALVVWGRNGL